MTFSASTMEQKSVPHDINSQQSFEALPLKLNGQRKIRVRTTESHPIQQSLGMNRPVEFTGGAFQNKTASKTMKTCIWQIIILVQEEILGPPPFIQSELVEEMPSQGDAADHHRRGQITTRS
jgi:hypothetical protein